MDSKEITLTGGEAGGLVVSINDEKQVVIKVTRVENEAGEIINTFEPSDEGSVYEVRGDMGVYIGESSALSGQGV